MKPDAIYYFDRVPEYQTRFIQTKHEGKIISNFPSFYKTGKHKGKGYVIFRRTSRYYNHGHLTFTHTIELAKSRIVTGMSFMPEYPRQSHGGYKTYGLLIEFSEDFNRLEIWFFKDMQEATPRLFLIKQAGGIPKVVKNNAISVRYRTHK
jgi:hypothetical protein